MCVRIINKCGNKTEFELITILINLTCARGRTAFTCAVVLSGDHGLSGKSSPQEHSQEGLPVAP
jgi:hypothetical protein